MGTYRNKTSTLKTKVPNPFVLLTPKNAHVKFLLWGPPGTGKTLWSLSGDHVAYISLESGADRYSNLKISAFCPKNLTELGYALKYLKSTKNQYQTVVVDSVSVAWAMFMSELIPEGVKPDWVMIKARWKKFLRTLLSIEKDVILIGRSKEARSESAWYVKTGDLVLDSEASTGFEFDFVGFSYVVENEGTGNLEFKIRLEKVRDLTGRVKTGMVLTNSTFKDYKQRLNDLLIESHSITSTAEGFIQSQRPSNKSRSNSLKAPFESPGDNVKSERNGNTNTGLMRNQLHSVMKAMELKTRRAQTQYCRQILKSNGVNRYLKGIEDLSVKEMSMILNSSRVDDNPLSHIN
jgi:hypothetical protein